MTWTTRRGDLGIALAFVLLAIASAHSSVLAESQSYHPYDAWGYALIVGQAVPMLWRTRAPRIVLWVTMLLWAVTAAIGYPQTATFFPLVVALYTLGAYVPRRSALLHGAVAIGIAVAWTAVGMAFTDHVPWSAPVSVILGIVVPIAIGLADNRRRQRLVELELRNQRREQVEAIAAADAVRAERARIARELHDVVAHEMTVMTLQAEGAKRRAQSSDPALAEALATISDSGRKGLAEMQRMIGVLRTSEREAEDEVAELTGRRRETTTLGTRVDDEYAPMPSLAAIPALVHQVEEAGMPVELTIAGTSHVPAGVELSAYRIVQESLTNALKYAGPGAQASVEVRRTPSMVTVTVQDDGRGMIEEAARSSGGHGLRGMRERVQTLGGTIDMGPRRGGGYRVHASLPVTDDQVGAARGPRPGAS